jgi:hypothetical protein
MPADDSSFDPYLEWLQIPRDRRPPDYYDLLGLSDFESDEERIRAAGLARTSQVRRYQLGRHAEDALRLISELSAAFDCLTTPERKLQYDADLRTRLMPQADVAAEALATPAIEIRTTAPARPRSSRTPSRRRNLTIALLATGCVAVVLLLLFVTRQPASTVASQSPSSSASAPARPKRVSDPRKNTGFAAPPATSPNPSAAQSVEENWQIASARYGFGSRWADTTATVRQNIRNDRIRFQVHNGSMRGDPAFGNIKSLELELVRGNERRSLRFREGQWVNLNLANAEPTGP